MSFDERNSNSRFVCGASFAELDRRSRETTGVTHGASGNYPTLFLAERIEQELDRRPRGHKVAALGKSARG